MGAGALPVADALAHILLHDLLYKCVRYGGRKKLRGLRGWLARMYKPEPTSMVVV